MKKIASNLDDDITPSM